MNKILNTRSTKTKKCFYYGKSTERREVDMMPLSLANTGEQNVVKRVGGKEDTRRFLENLGFVVGSTVTVVSEAQGNMIVNIKNSRVAIGKDMANKIMV